MKKTLIIAGIVLILALSITGVTRALLQDSEMSTGNTVQMSSLNLQVGETDPSTVQFSFPGLVGGETREFSTELRNTGDIPGNFWLEIQTVNSQEQNNSESETDVEGKGDLDDCAQIQVSFSNLQSGVVPVVPFTFLHSVNVIDQETQTLLDSMLEEGMSLKLELSTDFCGNESMGDSFDLDLIFHLDQI